MPQILGPRHGDRVELYKNKKYYFSYCLQCYLYFYLDYIIWPFS